MHSITFARIHTLGFRQISNTVCRPASLKSARLLLLLFFDTLVPDANSGDAGRSWALQQHDSRVCLTQLSGTYWAMVSSMTFFACLKALTTSAWH